MSPEENKAVIRRYFQEVLPQVRDGDLAATAALLTNDAAFQDPGRPPSVGRAAEKQRSAVLLSAMPDANLSLEEMVSWLGSIAGIPATGQLVRMTGTTIYHVIDGRIAEARSNLAQSGLPQQLGAIPAGQGAPVGDHS